MGEKEVALDGFASLPERKSIDLTDKVAVVTGGASGIGLAIVRELNSRGCKVVVASRNKERIEKVVSPLSHAVGFGGFNARDSKCVQDLFDFVDKRFGDLDILITSAGIGRGESATRLMPDPVFGLSEAEWDEVIGTNLKGVFLAARLAAQRMVKNKTGQIVNISSARGAKRGHAYGAGYCASKMAAKVMFDAMSIELGPFGVRVLSIMPDAVDTALIKDSHLGKKGAMTPERVGKFIVDALAVPIDSTLPHVLFAPFVSQLSNL